MGLLDDISSWADELDTSEPHEWGHGFDKSACYGDYPNGSKCPKLNEGRVDTCGCCGCPITNLSMSKAPPSSCPRLDDHAE